MSGPLVTVVVCAYNQVGTIAEAIDSALAQDHRPIEVVAVDNGSTDGTADVLRSYADHPEVRVVLHQQNDAVTRRINEAVALGTGEFVSLLYADDHYLPHKVRYQLERFAELDESYGVVYTPGLRHNVLTGEEWQVDSVEASGWVLLELLQASQRGRFVNPISPLIRRTCFEAHPMYDDVFVEGEGHYLRLAVTHRFAFLPEPTVVMREHDTNMGKAIKRNGENAAVILDRLADRHPLTDEQREAVEQAKAELFRNLGWQAVRVLHDGPWARACFARAAAIRPAERYRPKSLIGAALSRLPAPALRWVNDLGYRVRRPREHVTYKEDY